MWLHQCQTDLFQFKAESITKINFLSAVFAEVHSKLVALESA